MERQYTNEASNTGYQTVMKHTCDGGHTEFNVTMSIADWDSVKFFYQSHDENRDLAHDTVLSNCTDNGTNRSCLLFVGNVPQWQELGLPSENQPMMGWRCEAGDYGIREKSSVRYGVDGAVIE